MDLFEEGTRAGPVSEISVTGDVGSVWGVVMTGGVGKGGGGMSPSEAILGSSCKLGLSAASDIQPE